MLKQTNFPIIKSCQTQKSPQVDCSAAAVELVAAAEIEAGLWVQNHKATDPTLLAERGIH